MQICTNVTSAEYDEIVRQAEEHGTSKGKRTAELIRYALNGREGDEVERLEGIVKDLEVDKKSLIVRNAAAVEKYRDSEASKKAVITGLQHQVELLSQKVANLEDKLVFAHSHISELKQDKKDLQKDKELLQKQLELATLQLPAPKAGFWSRVFGRGKKEQQAEA